MIESKRGSLLLAATLLLLSAGPVHASTTPAQASESSASARSARYILHLSGGGVLRAVARQIDSGWEVQRGKSWLQFDEQQVERVARESDVLRELRKRRRELGKHADANARVELASWMAEAGLTKEALSELDGVLEVAPHNTAALRLVRETPLIATPSLDVAPSELPAAREALVSWAVQVPRAAREVAIARLGALEDRETVHAELFRALGAFSLRRRAFAAQALGRLYPGEDVKRLLQHAVLDTSSDVRRSAAEALGGADDASLVAPVVRALASSNPRVRVQAAEALGFMAYPAAVEPLVSYMTTALQSSGANRVPHGYVFFGRQRAYIQDFDVEVATFQAVADPQINVLLEGSVLEAGVIGLTHYSAGTEAAAARGSLRRITGENPGNSARAWRGWWEEHREEWALAALSKPETP